MKFELKTEKDYFLKPFFSSFFILTIVFFLIFLYSLSTKLAVISKHYEINYLCKLLLVDNSPSNFKRISRLTNQTSKQKIWDLCKEIARN